MKRKLILSLAFILTLTGGINVSIEKNYASDNEITDLAKSLTETANKIIPNSSLIKYVNDTLVFFNGEQVTDLSIYNYNNSTYLPLRAIGDLLGAKVNWFAEDMVAQVSLDNTQIEVLNNTNTVVIKKDDVIEESKITTNVNGQSVNLPTLNINGNIYLPLRYISETFSINIDYTVNHEKTGVKTIEIYNTKEKQAIKYEKSDYNQNSNIPLAWVSRPNKNKTQGDNEAIYEDEYGYIDKTGKLVIPYQPFGQVYEFSEGLAQVVDYYGKSGYIDKTGKLVIPYQFERAESFSDGLALVRHYDTEKFGYIDKTGKLVIPYQYDFLQTSSFNEGLAVIKDYETKKMGYIDKTGNIVIPCQFSQAFMFNEGLAPVQDPKTGKYGYIDRTGKLVIPYQFNAAYVFSEGMAAVSNMTSEFIWDYIDPHKQTGHIELEEKYGYIDKTGKLIIPYKFKAVEPFNDGVALVYNKERNPWGGVYYNSAIGYIDKTGEIVQEPYEIVQSIWVPRFSEGLANVEDPKTGKYGYIDRTGKLVIPYQFDVAGEFGK